MRDVAANLSRAARSRAIISGGSGAAANYRAACRRKSTADFISKIGTAIEETDESDFWLEFSVASGLTTAKKVTALRQEAGELLAIFIASRQTARANLKGPKPENPNAVSFTVAD